MLSLIFNYLKIILLDDSFKEIKPMVLLKCIYCNKKSLLFQLVVFKRYAIIKTVLLFQLVAMNNYWKQSLRCVPWNQLKSENIETLYLLSSQKNHCRSAIRKDALLWNKHEYQHSADIFVKNTLLAHFMALASFYTPWNILENQRFPDVFRGHRKRPVSWNGLKVIYSISSYLFCYLTEYK